MEVIKEKKIRTYRGNELHWMYKPKSRAKETKIRRLFRLIDSYVKISGDNTHFIEYVEFPINVASSRFLRPYNPKLAFLEKLRLNRICEEMTVAAAQRTSYTIYGGILIILGSTVKKILHFWKKFYYITSI